MPDTKITALAAITTVDPAADVLPIVDISDTSMAASGTTKKITSNQILGAGGTATLASATISGALDAARLNVTGATIPANGVYLGSANNLSFSAASTLGMTLNATGLAIGDTAFAGTRLTLRESASQPNALAMTNRNATQTWRIGVDVSAVDDKILGFYDSTSTTFRMQLTDTGNLGIGVAPSAWGGSNRSAIQFPGGNAIQGSGSLGLASFNNAYNNGTNDIYIANGVAYKHIIGTGFQWYTAPSGTANNVITWTQAMTLDASGALLVGTATAPNVGAASTVSGFSINGAGNNAYIASKIDNGTCGYFRRDGTDGAALNFYKANSAVGNISVTTSACTFNSTSDYRLKESVQPLTGGLARVSALKPSIYKWKADGSNGEGFIAHELAEVVPAAVSGEKDAVNEDGSIKPQGVDMSRVVPILVAAIQELTARVQTLETR